MVLGARSGGVTAAFGLGGGLDLGGAVGDEAGEGFDDARVEVGAGRALDHIGFEIKNLEEFTRKLEADGVKLAVP